MSSKILFRLSAEPSLSVAEAGALFPRSHAYLNQGFANDWFRTEDGEVIKGSRDNPWKMRLLSHRDIFNIARHCYSQRDLTEDELRTTLKRLFALTQK